ncbi:hypothetical protein ZIOFF_045324 [Zingiber officinale]|uniref:VTT domain-containing protein n=2 Tax=Magnoliopsida TaxID=3398 RepID=A0A8J5L0Y3_ZINOF|nr:hypothetical protein ZIOFF_045324 [Zingiber officinale]
MHSTRPCLFSPCPTPLLPIRFSSASSSSFSSIKPHRIAAFRPLSSVKESKNKKATLRKASDVPQNLSLENGKGRGDGELTEDGEGDLGRDAALKGTVLAGFLLVGVVGGFGTAGYVYKDQINAFLAQFSGFIDGELEMYAEFTSIYFQLSLAISCCSYGPAGYALFVLVYAGLEVATTQHRSSSSSCRKAYFGILILAIPAIPLTMSAGLLFGSLIGTIIVSISGTVAAAVAFLIARYFARERILKLVEGNKKFLAIDKAIGENGFRVVTLLRLSPLLPFSLGNYLYGLTSVKFVPYVLGSWLGMLPGTWAYVSAGAFGRAIIQGEYSRMGLSGWDGQLVTFGLGLLFTALAASYVTRLAKKKSSWSGICDINIELSSECRGSGIDQLAKGVAPGQPELSASAYDVPIRHSSRLVPPEHGQRAPVVLSGGEHQVQGCRYAKSCQI